MSAALIDPTERSRTGVTITIFGAGITGLSAAHELVERGFRVLIVETEWDEQRRQVVLGGGAASYDVTRGSGCALQSPFSAGGFEAFEPGISDASVATPEQMAVERGTRHFPVHFRHLFDTLRRIPQPAAGPSATVFDTLVEAGVGVASAGVVHPLLARLGRTPTLSEVQHGMHALLSGQVTAPELQLLLLRLVRYLTTSPARRSAECDEISLLGFFFGSSSDKSVPAHEYSKTVLRQLNAIAMALVGVEAASADARSALSTLIHAVVSQNRGAGHGFALPGASDVLWFNPWRVHIEANGGQFRRGTLRSLSLEQQKLVVDVDWHGQAPETDLFPSDYYLIATDVVAAESISRSLRSRAGVPGDLAGFTSVVPMNTGVDDRKRHVSRDPHLLNELGMDEGDRLRCWIGLQFFFGERIELGFSELWLVDTDWQLSLHVLKNVNIGNSVIPGAVALKVHIHALSVKANSGPASAKTALECTAREMALEAWHQIERSLPENDTKPHPRPAWFIVDDRVRFDQERATIGAAYIAPITGDWNARPGSEPSPHFSTPRDQQIVSRTLGNHATAVEYDCLVFAGAYLRTFTRAPGAEAANESARHAVNSILEHLRERRAAESTRCQVWDPEQEEHSVFRAWRDLDQKLFEQNLPHLSELLGLDLLLKSWSQMTKSGTSLTNVLSLFGGQPTSSIAAGGPILELLRRIRAALEEQLRPSTEHDTSNEKGR
jgi:hypothetical protein